MRSRGTIALLFIALAADAIAQLDTLVLDQDHPVIEWRTAPTSDAGVALKLRLLNGELHVESKAPAGYLTDLLKAMDVPVSSQMLVYSNASLQGLRIRPDNPRALYFNDTTVVGAVGGTDLIEVAVHDPRQGVLFYTMIAGAGKAQLVRQTFCTNCHETQFGVPGMVLHSVPTGVDGKALFQLGAWEANDRTPFENRWGGWYVTGQFPPFRHMGNQLIADSRKPGELAPAVAGLAKVEAPWTAKYLADTSDVVALLVFEHQAETLNWITRVGWHARIAASAGKAADTTRATVEALVDALLFVKEVRLPVSVASTSGFAAEFAGRGPKDKTGRSLRAFDLEQRLFRYPMSYLIYSPAIDALPEAAKAQVYERLWKILSGALQEPRYEHLTLETRRAIVEILLDTKAGLPSYFLPQSIQ